MCDWLNVCLFTMCNQGLQILKEINLLDGYELLFGYSKQNQCSLAERAPNNKSSLLPLIFKF